MFSASFLHSQNDLMHVLGNVIILALVGVPLEQGLGTKGISLSTQLVYLEAHCGLWLT